MVMGRPRKYRHRHESHIVMERDEYDECVEMARAAGKDVHWIIRQAIREYKATRQVSAITQFMSEQPMDVLVTPPLHATPREWNVYSQSCDMATMKRVLELFDNRKSIVQEHYDFAERGGDHRILFTPPNPRHF